MFGNTYGLDLGTVEIKVYNRKKDTLWKEKNAVAIENQKKIISVGDQAYAMYERAPENIEIQFPMKEGVISHFYNMQYLLQNIIQKDRRFTPGSKYIVAVPTDVTEVEKKAFFDLVVHSTAKAKEVRTVERGIADAIGMGLDVKKEPGTFIVNLGGETTELSVLSYGGVVLNKLLKIGAADYDYAIIQSVRHNQEFLIGKLTAETLRKTYGICPKGESKPIVVSGQNLITRVPQQMEVPVPLVHAAMKDILKTCTHEINFLLERTPPEVQSAIRKQGICLTGGMANLAGIDTYMENALGIPAHVPQEPEYCAVRGIKKIMESKVLYEKTKRNFFFK